MHKIWIFKDIVKALSDSFMKVIRHLYAFYWMFYLYILSNPIYIIFLIKTETGGTLLIYDL